VHVACSMVSEDVVLAEPLGKEESGRCHCHLVQSSACAHCVHEYASASCGDVRLIGSGRVVAEVCPVCAVTRLTATLELCMKVRGKVVKYT